MRCRYNAVNFLKKNSKRRPIACPLGRGMGCLLWIQHVIDILRHFLQLLMQYLTILDRVITVFYCTQHTCGATGIKIKFKRGGGVGNPLICMVSYTYQVLNGLQVGSSPRIHGISRWRFLSEGHGPKSFERFRFLLMVLSHTPTCMNILS